MAKKRDLTGQRFGRLVALCDNGWRDACGNVYWWCECDCGEIWLVQRGNLTSGGTKSCGCLQRQASRQNIGRPPLHGHTHKGGHSSAYGRWMGMHYRCSNPKSKGYKNYGGRGIRVCERWQKFENFLADMGEPPPGLTLDRINNDGDYEPDNCRWATWEEQNNNQRPKTPRRV